MAQDRIFAKGLYFNTKHENAPSFVLGSISIKASTIAELAAQVEEYQNDKGYCRFQILQSKDGKSSVSIDTYGVIEKKKERPGDEEIGDITINDIPF